MDQIENITNSRVLIITDREELDGQIEGVFQGVEEQIVRAKNGAGLIEMLNSTAPWLMCSLIHKFGRRNNEEEAFDDYLEQIKNSPLQVIIQLREISMFILMSVTEHTWGTS